MRIQNTADLLAHGNRDLRRKMLQILEAGLAAADPYQNVLRLLRRQGHLLYVGDSDFEAQNDPQSGVEVIDLDTVRRVFVVGAGKGAHRVALALEEVLGEYLSGGELICKYGDEVSLSRIHVTLGAHPLPDENCVAGCLRILNLARDITERDLVFTVIANGGSSLLTLPFDGIPLADVMQIVHTMQIEKGVSTMELNAVRNHIDQLKGGRIARAFHAAHLIHLVVTDANHPVMQQAPSDYAHLMRHNVWLHNLPDGTTFARAVEVLRRHNAWESCPPSIRDCLLRADPAQETVKHEEFSKMRFRVFGIMPDKLHFFAAAKRAAAALGFCPLTLSDTIHFEASQVGFFAGSIAHSMEMHNEPIQAPAALFSTGELLVTVGEQRGVGGRNQEYALAAATTIAGCARVVIASVDTDGTDGPGGLRLPGAPACLAGGIVDGNTVKEAEESGIDIREALRAHDVSATLWKLGCGIHAQQNISMTDLTVILVDKP